ncbi:MAG: serine/threonine-protein kinase [Xenococcaceae cyanobacterium MO_207.B15]|nr:serine/threonine-protein kinase [Xenococcaceae cyanobacterium MO_207.B15]
MECCRPNPPCLYFCRLDGRLIKGKGVIANPETGWEYEVLETLAIGGMSTSYLVYSYYHKKLAVLKEISAELAQKAKGRQMFQREARILSSLEHSGIPRYYDFFDTSERYSLIMELIHGQNLEKIPTYTTLQVIDWMIELSEILGYLQNLNPPVIHRDIKPANLILRYNPRQIVLIDFGAVKEATTPPGTRIATPGFGAPEQSTGNPCIQSDFYALGATLIYFVTKRVPTHFYDLNQKKFVGLEAIGIPKSLVQVIENLTEFYPEHRPQNAIAVKELLQQAKSSLI